MMKRPDTEKQLSGLKDFQRKTVDYVFSRLYLDAEPTNRFLIADEVGLGKTLIARGVIAKAVDHLWDRVNRIDIVYICSNADIARQNIDRLNITDEEKVVFASRLTRLPLEIHNIREKKLNFISFTPQTSLNLQSKGGEADERILLYYMLDKIWNFNGSKGPVNLLQGGVQNKENWRRRLKEFDHEIDPSLQEEFHHKLKNDHPQLEQEFKQLAAHFQRYKENIPEDDRKARNRLIGELRTILAKTCITVLKPNLIILDEFQRFKDLLDDNGEVDQIAKELFEHSETKMILLSATPYKMYTIYNEREADDHYQDLIKTIRYVFHDQARTDKFEVALKQYRKELFHFTSQNRSNLVQAKNDIERQLRQIMVRNERIHFSQDFNAMLKEVDEQPLLEPRELKVFQVLDQVAGKLDVGDPVRYWMSAPYLLNFMERNNYKLKDNFVKVITQKGALATDLQQLLDQREDVLLDWQKIYHYKPIAFNNAKLQSLVTQNIDNGAWQLLWIPPSLPYYRTQDGPYADDTLRHFTKSLIFSTWQVVPRTVATLCSYEAERRMVAGSKKRTVKDENYHDLWDQHVQLLRFGMKGDRASNMYNFNLFYPCLTLARKIDPLLFRMENPDSLPDLAKVIQRTASQIEKWMQPIIDAYANPRSPEDRRWYWMSLALLDRKYYKKSVGSWLFHREEKFSWGHLLQSKGNEQRAEHSGFQKHVHTFQTVFKGEIPRLGRPPADLYQVLSKIALASPAVIALRSLERVVGMSVDLQSQILQSAAQTALHFRMLFNLPDSVQLISSLKRVEESSYWASVLEYCLHGNLQSVMDEYMHVLRETNGLTDKKPEYVLQQIVDKIGEAVTIQSVNLDVDEVVTHPKLAIEKRRIRCRYALKFGDTSEKDGGVRAEQVRSAFNSPFRPFILATTSIGQEGLDFHLYCHRIYHWNLPSNPVDLEQREGRIHRYKGHAIRRNVAKEVQCLHAQDQFRGDPWDALFQAARNLRTHGMNDLIPYWVYDKEDGYKIYRHFMALPLSKEMNNLPYLKRTLGAYRMVFGQPRQEDLLRYLCNIMETDQISMEDLMDCKINLVP